jgi:two-component system, sensor histidine kinase PdtaS
VDLAGKIVLVNAQTEKIFEYRREQLVGPPLELFVSEPFPKRHAGHGGAFPREPRTRSLGTGLKLFARRKNGPQFPVEINLSQFAFCDDKLVYSRIQYISERKSSEKARRRLPEKEALFSELLYKFQNNLRVVSGLLNLQAGQLGDPPERQRDGKLRAERPGDPKFKIVFSSEARRI